MSARPRTLPTSVQLKFIVGATGALLALFVLAHLAGNLQIFLGPDAINSYAATLKSMPGPLWIARLTLLAAVCLHIWGIFKLRARNQAARPIGYSERQPIVSTVFSRTMFPTGLVILAFVVYHLGHFTLGLTNPNFYALLDDQGRHDVFSMMVLSFQQPLIAITYLIAMCFLGMHLAHGVASVFQTGGLRKPQWKPYIDLIGRLFALVIVIGNFSIPLACLLGFIQPMQVGL